MQQKMYHVYDRPVIANYAVEYSDSYSIVTYTHLAQLSSVWASHSHLSMFQLVYGMEKKFVVNSIFNKWRTLLLKMFTRLWRIVVAECFVFRNIRIEMDTLIQIFDAITK